jgi:spore maturation protein CgeB
MLRILLVGAAAPESAIEFSYVRAFEALGVDVTLFDPARDLARLAVSRVLARAAWPVQHLWVGKVLRDFFARDARWDVVIVFKGMFIPAQALSDAIARSRGALWMCFDPDDPFDPGRAMSSVHVRAAIPLYHTYLIWSRRLIPAIQAAGCADVEYLPFAADPSVHFPAPELDASLRNVITFVGTRDSQREALLETLADLPLRIYGNAWQRVHRSSKLRPLVVPRSIFGAELRRVVTSSAASLNIMRPQNAGSHNMRTFEVPAMGGLMITSRSSEQAAFFPEQEACLMYDDPSELRSLAESMLRSDGAARAAIARAALERAKPHTYLERARTLLTLIAARR